MPVYYRTDMAEIHVELTGIPLDKESWDMMEGGDPVAPETPHFPGGMQPQVELGGLPKWTPIVVERGWAESLALVYKTIANTAGSTPATVSYIQLGANKQPTGVIDTYTGVLLAAERPKYKATESTEAFLKLTIGVNGQVN
jgi:hypothetical protein